MMTTSKFNDPGRSDFPYGHMGEMEHDMETMEDSHRTGCGSAIERGLWILFALAAVVILFWVLIVFLGGIH